jgi:hypothetical protein
MDAKEIRERAAAFVTELTTESPDTAVKPDFLRYRHMLIKYGVMIRELARLIEKGD